MPRIISHEKEEYSARHTEEQKQNGAFYYSREIVQNIIPRVQTDRSWVTIYIRDRAASHSIYFIHNNRTPELYSFLRLYKDVVLVCGVPQTCEKVKRFGRAIYLPLSIDTEYVKQFEQPEKTIEVAYIGRANKRNGLAFPEGTVFIEGLNRDDLLRQMAKVKKVYAVGRCALEAKCLGAEILPFDPRYPDPELWQVIDNREAAQILQRQLDEIDGREPEDGDGIYKGIL